MQQGNIAYSSYPMQQQQQQQQGRPSQMAGHGMPAHQEPLTSQMLASANPHVCLDRTFSQFT
jgi:hypothetical protein